MYLTTAEYATYTGETAPSDFTPCLTLAEALIDGHTLHYYAQVSDITALPARVLAWLKQAIAYQVQAISQGGGIAGSTEQQQGSVSLGKYSYTNGVNPTHMLCAPTSALLPFLLAYARGAMV